LLVLVIYITIIDFLTINSYYIGDQFIEPCGFSGSLPLLFCNVRIAIFVFSTLRKIVGWLVATVIYIYSTVGFARFYSGNNKV